MLRAIMIILVVSNTRVLIIGPSSSSYCIISLQSKNKGNLDNFCGQRGGWRRQWENVVSARTPLSSLPLNHICTIWREHRTPEPPQPQRYDDAKAFQAGIHCAPGTSCQKLLKTHLSNFQYCKISLFKLSWQSHTNMVFFLTV